MVQAFQVEVQMFKALLLTMMLSATVLAAVPGEVSRSFPSPSPCASGLAFDGENLWLADFKTDSLYALSPGSGRVVEALPAPSYRPYGLAWDGSYLWVVDGEENSLIQFDVKSGVNLRTIPSPVDRPTGLAWDGSNLWLADHTSIQMISTEDGTTIKSFPAPASVTTDLAFDGTYLWSADRIKNSIYMIYPETGEVLMILDSPAPYAWGLAFAEGKLYNADYQSDSLYEIVTDGDGYYSQTERQRQNMLFTAEVRNYGPGYLKSLDLYLAIPENSFHQTLLTEPLYFSRVTPQHVTDRWGQNYACFRFNDLPSGGKATASYFVTADLYDTRFFIRPEKVGNLKDIPKEISKTFLADDTKFDLKNPVIQKAVKEAVGSETNPYWMARRIYRWIIDHMYYELAGGWNVAPAIIERGNGSCSEYSFVFIAMCRAAGIPARFTGSIATRGDLASEDDVFHRWCEIYLPPYGWIPVDPSAGDTESPEGQAARFGYVGNRYLVTTTGAGSEYIGWGYNAGAKWQSVGKCKIQEEAIGEWTPADTALTPSGYVPPGGQHCRPKK
jgi:transglutaminase-like putative cysteine protease